MTVGGTFSSAGTTKIENLSNSNVVVWGSSSDGIGVEGGSTSGMGVVGGSTSGTGVSGGSVSGTAVYGGSTSSVGVFGFSNSNIGAYSRSQGSTQPATLGWAEGSSTGVQGYSGGGSRPPAKAKTGVYGYAAQDTASRGVTGESPAGIGVYGISSTGYAGFFGGKVYTTQFYELTEIATPATPVANRARLFIKDNGLGKTQVCVKFANGTVKVLATEG